MVTPWSTPITKFSAFKKEFAYLLLFRLLILMASSFESLRPSSSSALLTLISGIHALIFIQLYFLYSDSSMYLFCSSSTAYILYFILPTALTLPALSRKFYLLILPLNKGVCRSWSQCFFDWAKLTVSFMLIMAFPDIYTRFLSLGLSLKLTDLEQVISLQQFSRWVL